MTDLVGKTLPKIVVIRGPSGSGKSTTANALAESLRKDNNVVCYFDMDYFRLKIPGDNVDNKASARLASAMLGASIRAALQQGSHVILEGLLSRKSFGAMIDELQAEAPTYKFYFRIEFEETLRRHSTREKRNEFGEAEMRRWYPNLDVEISDDIIIEQGSSPEESVRFIRSTIGF